MWQANETRDTQIEMDDQVIHTIKRIREVWTEVEDEKWDKTNIFGGFCLTHLVVDILPEKEEEEDEKKNEEEEEKY